MGLVKLVCENIDMTMQPMQPIERLRINAEFPVDAEQARQLGDMLTQPVKLTVIIEEIPAAGA